MEPLAGATPAGSSYKGDPQVAAKRQKKWWAATVLPRVLRFKRPLHHSLMLAARKWSQSRVLPSAELAYETGLSAGSIAKWIPHPELHRARTRVPGECIADNALGALKMVGARRLARPRLPDSESGGSAIPREPRADETGVPDRLRSGDLLHEMQACWTGLHHRDGRNGFVD